MVQFKYITLIYGDEMIREIKIDELNELLELYTHLHELGVPEHNEDLEKMERNLQR